MLTKIEYPMNIRELQLAHPPANALNPALVHELQTALQLAAGEKVQAIILSGTDGMFSAGLDIPALLKLDRTAMREFWKEFIGLLRTIATSSVPIAAALTGHAPAGGAVLAIFCDTRIAAQGNFKIGLNEVRVGLPVPPLIHAALVRLVGARQAERLCVHGMLISPDEALDIGLVDQLLPPNKVVMAALEWCRSLLELPAEAVAATRRLARSDLVEMFARFSDLSHDELTRVWFGEEAQSSMYALLAELAALKAGINR